MKMSVRFGGIIEDTMNKLVTLGYFKSKNDALRAGILRLGKEYNLLPKEKELEKKLLELKQTKKTKKKYCKKFK